MLMFGDQNVDITAVYDGVFADPAAFAHDLDWALRWVLVIGSPAAVALELEVQDEALLGALKNFGGIDRRMQELGELEAGAGR